MRNRVNTSFSQSTRLTARATVRSCGVHSLSALLGVFCDEPGQAVQFFLRDSGTLATEQRGDDLFRRALKKRFDEVAQSGTSCNVTRHRRNIDIPQAVLFVLHVPFVFKYAQLGADG